ncbi:MAG: hypothetical protein KatS3mg118_0538 [Paracoccaceae bacterium]|nr:MAG: hypothetical protein KatS3mg118_0538 [Paracoccaceae bacterium]
MRVNPTGAVTVLTGCHSHGQGHETAFAQVVAEMLGIDESQSRGGARRHRQHPLRHGHLRLALAAGGRFGHRARSAEKVIAKAKKIAAHLLEANEADIDFANGTFTVKGTDRSKSWGEVCLAAYVPAQLIRIETPRARPRG